MALPLRVVVGFRTRSTPIPSLSPREIPNPQSQPPFPFSPTSYSRVPPPLYAFVVILYGPLIILSCGQAPCPINNIISTCKAQAIHTLPPPVQLTRNNGTTSTRARVTRASRCIDRSASSSTPNLSLFLQDTMPHASRTSL